MNKTYRINEVFHSLQGEGVRAGTVNTFIRFSGCNMECDIEPGLKSPGGFACDTEFASGRSVTLEELAEWVLESKQITVKTPGEVWQEPWVILTGGEPGLQVDREFIDYWHDLGWKLAIETNGSICLPKRDDWPGQDLIDWITLSPKVAEHAVKQMWANEIKYVRGWGQGIPKPVARADHYLISPAFDGMEVHPRTLDWCIKLCLENPKWRLSCQSHKLWRVR